MKNIYKLFLLALVFTAGSMIQSCETLELEQLDNPNNLTSGNPDFLLNSIQTVYRASQVTFNDRSSELTRIDYMFGRNYFANYGAATMNGVWSNLYSSILPNIAEIESLQNDDNDLRMHIAIGKIMQAHMIMQIVDFIGDIVPMERATDPVNFPTPEPTTDAGASSYANAVSILDEAIALLEADPAEAQVDLYFEGDASAWIKVANTLKMRAALTQSQYSNVISMAASMPYISDTSDDFEWKFGTQLAPVNTQHQDYAADYTSAGANIYQNHWLIQLMLDSNDPRIRYYMTRQNDCTPGASCNTAGNGETLQCSLQSVPAHLQNTPCGDIWCYMENGYWGRPHGNDEGIPPDNFTRTAVGVYPAAGLFDDDDFEGVNLGKGGNGAGIEPIILASYVDFWLAEAHLAQGNTDMARDYMEAGITKSIAKVQGFIALDSSADTSFEPSNDDVDAFIADQVAAFDDADNDAERWNLLAENYWVTLYGGGADAHNFYRRTGYPTTVCPNIDPAPGNYPRTFLFPSNEVAVNPNFTQRTDNNDAVFWNTQPLPSAN